MNELLPIRPERKLWYDGPNYTADAVILDIEAEKVLLIQRKDTGEWALPGGFVDPEDISAHEAAIREAGEEAGLDSLGNGALVYQGRTSDSRSSDTAWIETSAYLFRSPSTEEVQAGDDAVAAAWHNLGDLPDLYGAHQMLIERALEYTESEQLFAAIDANHERFPITGGYMKYDKFIAAGDGQTVFVKQQPNLGEVNPDRYAAMLNYIEKEAGTMAHLRLQGFKHVPRKSALRGDQLAMDALRENDGWQWEAPRENVDVYVQDALTVFRELESTPLPTDVFEVAPSYESLRHEGWQSFDKESTAKLFVLLAEIPADKSTSALDLISDIPALRYAASQLKDPEEFVFCHLDMRQENLAWHPEKGVRIIDWSWAGPGLPGSDATSLLIDLHKNGYDVSNHLDDISNQHCLNLMGFWLAHCTLPNQGSEGLRTEQFLSAVSAYELLTTPRRPLASAHADRAYEDILAERELAAPAPLLNQRRRELPQRHLA